MPKRANAFDFTDRDNICINVTGYDDGSATIIVAPVDAHRKGPINLLDSIVHVHPIALISLRNALNKIIERANAGYKVEVINS